MAEMENKGFTKEMMQAARTCQTVEEIAAFAKDNGIEMTEEEAAAYFRMIQPAYGELEDEELDNVCGRRMP